MKRVLVALVAAMSALFIAAPIASASVSAAKSGGALNVAEDNGVTWASLDPATDTQASLNANIMNAIYGQLFEQGPKGTFVPDLATAYNWSAKGLALNLTIRKDVKFQDGTPFTAAAVASSMTRVLTPSFACTCDSEFADVTSITSSGSTVTLHLAKPNATILQALVASGPDWTVSPTALASEPEATFAQHPVGAGPFEVVSNIASSTIQLARNPHYWLKGEPKLATLTFTAVAADQTAYNALQSGQYQVILNPATSTIASQAKAAGFSVPEIPGLYSQGMRFNTTKPPFNNILAREAIYYATNPKVMGQVGSPNFFQLVQAPAGPGDAYFEKTVPGYRKYDPSKAQALVNKLGGLSFTILGTNTPAGEDILAAEQEEWQAVGMHVTIVPDSTPALIVATIANSWEAMNADDGDIDPDIGILGLVSDFYTHGTLSGDADPTLDGLIDQSQQFISGATRQRAFDKIYKYISDQAYNPMFYAEPDFAVVSKSVVGATLVGGPSVMMNFEGVTLK